MPTLKFVVERAIAGTKTYRVISPTRNNFAAVNVFSREDMWKPITAEAMQANTTKVDRPPSPQAAEDVKAAQANADKVATEKAAVSASAAGAVAEQNKDISEQKTFGVLISDQNPKATIAVSGTETYTKPSKSEPTVFSPDATFTENKKLSPTTIEYFKTEIPSSSRNNPGNIRDVTTGKIATFSSPDAGASATLRTVERYISGENRTFKEYLKKNNKTIDQATIQDMFNVYAPAADSNNPRIYAATVASRLGVSPQTRLKEIEANKYDLIREIARFEGPDSYEAWSRSSLSRQSKDYWLSK